jgi:selenoprotein W-related protein
LADEILSTYKTSVESLTMIPSAGGVFEVNIGDNLVYSKKATGRHAEEGEVMGLIAEKTHLGAVPAD